MCAHGPTQPALSGIRSEVPGVGGGRANKDAKKCSLVRPWERGLNAALTGLYVYYIHPPKSQSHCSTHSEWDSNSSGVSGAR